MRAYVGTNHKSWDREVPKLGFALRSARHDTTSYSPAYLNFGRELKRNWETVPPDQDRGNEEEVPYVEDPANFGAKLKDLQKVFKEVEGRLIQDHQKNTQRYNLRRRPLNFSVNDKVWKRNFVLSDATKAVCAKLAPKFIGPFVVSKKISPLVYQLKDEKGKIIGNWHVSDLKPYN